MEECMRFGVSLPKGLLDRFDTANEKKGYANRSEAIRDLIRRSLVDSEWEESATETAAAVVLVYDHHKHGVSEHLTGVQHAHYHNIVSTMHAHLDHDNCMEVILLRGPASDVRTLGDALVSMKHVKLGRFVPATLGRDI